MTNPSQTFLSLSFQGDTRGLLKKRWKGQIPLHYPLTRRASIKDIIEALGVPHTEVGRILIGDKDLDFHFVPGNGDKIDIHPLSAELPITAPTTIRPNPVTEIKFMVDINIRKLGRFLRMAGIDTSDTPNGSIKDVAATAVRSSRVLLSANRDLLKQSKVIFGRLVRESNPIGQFQEISRLFELKSHFRPFSRCMECNEILAPVKKHLIMDRLKPLTRKYYNVFMICRNCERIYWPGSHHENMVKELKRLGF